MHTILLHLEVGGYVRMSCSIKVRLGGWLRYNSCISQLQNIIIRHNIHHQNTGELRHSFMYVLERKENVLMQE